MEILFGELCTMVVGLFFAILGVASATASCRLWRRGARTVAIVVGHEKTENGKFPIVEFQDATSTTRRATLPYGDNRTVGSVVKVIYHPEEREGVQENSFPDMFFFPFFFCFVGGAVLLVAVLLFTARIRVE
jgi:hypothetical protein